MSVEKFINISDLYIRTIRYKDYQIIKDFKCGNSSLERFLTNDAYYSTINKEASTSLVFYKEEFIGYFTLRQAKLNIEIDLSQLSSPYCLDVARLAVSVNFQNRGFGSSIIKKIIEIANSVNERFITLDALIEKYEWYQRRGFSNLIEDEILESNQEGLVYMILDLYDEYLIDEYFELAN